MTSIFKKTGTITAVIVSILPISGPCLAQPYGIDSRLNSNQVMSDQQRRTFRELDVAILLELIKLARFNIQFNQQSNVRWKWRSLLYPLVQEAGTACSLANALVDFNERAGALNNPELISDSARKCGIKSAVVGSVLGGTSSAAELAQNSLVCAISSKSGFSPKDSLARVCSSRDFIDQSLVKRQKLIDELSNPKVKEIRQLESLIFMRIRNQLLRQFKRWSASSRSRMWRENTFYVLDVTQEILTFSSNLVSLQAFNNSQLGGRAAILGLVGKSISTVNPLVRTLVGKAVNHHQTTKLTKALVEPRVERAETLMAPWGEIEKILDAATKAGSTDRQIEQLGILTTDSLLMDNLMDKETRQLEKLQRVATQQAISGPAIGSLSLTQQILGTVAFYGYKNDSLTSNRIRFAGRIPQIAGLSYSLINTPTTQILGVLKNEKLKKQGKLPSQDLKTRLDHLDQLEATVRGWIKDNGTR